MDINRENQPKAINQQSPSKPESTKIDLNAPAGSPNSLGAESVRDGRPDTDDSVIEAIDEEPTPFADVP